jgi:hypothetical protein
MKLRLLLTIVIIFLLDSIGFSQINLEWTNTYHGFGLQLQLWCMDVDAKGNTYVTGSDWEGWKILKVASSGNTIWIRIDSTNHSKLFVKADHQANCIVAGDSVSLSNGDVYLNIQKISPDGSLLWDYIYPHSGDNFPVGLKVDDEDNIYVSVERNNSDDTISGIDILKLDPSGNLLWHNLNENNKVWWDRNFEILPDHGIINQYFSYHNNGPEWKNDSHLYRLNSAGETIWQVDSSRQTTSDVSVDQFQNSYLSVANDTEYYLLKYDAAGHQLWKKILFNDVYFYENILSGIDKDYTYSTFGKLMMSSALYLVVDESNDNMPPGSTRFAIHLFKIDFDGNILWQHDYINPQVESSAGRNLFQTCNGNLILEGYEYYDTLSPNVSQIFVLALDTFGNEISKNTVVLDSVQNQTAGFNATAIDDSMNTYYCIMDGLTSLETRKFSYITCNLTGIEENNFDNDIAVFPNPANDVLYADIKNSHQNGSLQLINSLGQVMYDHSTDGTQTAIDVSNFPQGIYWVAVKSENNSLAKKIVIQH